MSPFDYFILTRFNLPLTAAVDAEDKHKGLDEEWLERRFELFERVCLPSVQYQTERAFHWLIFLDGRTPERFRQRMNELSLQNSFICPIYASWLTVSDVLEEIRKRETAGRPRITMRLDNDDAIHPRMIEKVINTARTRHLARYLKQGYFISFPIGCSESGGDLYIQRFRYNPFVSFVSAPTLDRTVWSWEHTRIAESAPVVCRYTRPMWCQVIHGKNVSNSVKGVYWPFSHSGGLSIAGTHVTVRSRRWQIGETIRSARRYLFP
jgi:hypothetical protein